MMGNIERFPRPPAMPAVARILGQYDRAHVEHFIEIAVALLDTMDGPADPDSADFTSLTDGQPGDLADHEPGGDDEPGAYGEWLSLTVAQRRVGACPVGSCGHEDDELAGDETDGNGAEDDECAWFRAAGRAAGCPVADPDVEHDGKEGEGSPL